MAHSCPPVITLKTDVTKGTLNLHRDGSFQYNYTGSGSYPDTDTFTYSITDTTETESNTATVTITISAAGPTSVNDNYSVTVGQALTATAGGSPAGLLDNDTYTCA